jgi:hypothetical protein
VRRIHPWPEGLRDIEVHQGTSVFYGLPFWCMALILHGVFHIGPEYYLLEKPPE